MVISLSRSGGAVRQVEDCNVWGAKPNRRNREIEVLGAMRRSSSG